jgi:hypothetical protein
LFMMSYTYINSLAAPGFGDPELHAARAHQPQFSYIK